MLSDMGRCLGQDIVDRSGPIFKVEPAPVPVIIKRDPVIIRKNGKVGLAPGEPYGVPAYTPKKSNMTKLLQWGLTGLGIYFIIRAAT